MAHFKCIVFSDNETQARIMLTNKCPDWSYKQLGIAAIEQVPLDLEAVILEDGSLIERDGLRWAGFEPLSEYDPSIFLLIVTAAFHGTNSNDKLAFLFDCHI